MQHRDERTDRNIPDPVERRLYRERIREAARSEEPVWKEAAGPGSFHWLWKRGVRLAPSLTALAALALCAAGVIGWLLGLDWMTGAVLNGPPVPIASAVPIAILAVCLLLMRFDRSDRSQRAGQALAAIVLVAEVALLSALVPIAWGEDSLRAPSTAAAVNFALLALGLLTVDRDPPRFRWNQILVPAIGILLVASLVSKGYETFMLESQPAQFSYAGSLAVALVYFGFVFIRPRRGLPRFLAATGPGPSMARLLVPAAVLIPAAMVLGDLIAEQLDPAEGAFLKGLDKMLMLILLLWVITHSSKRLQRFYESWQGASAELASQAGVFNRMSEGVVMLTLSDSRIVLTNPQFDAMHGYRRGELLGRHIDIIAPPDLTNEELELRRGVLHELADRGETTYENRSVKKDGSDIWSRVNGLVTNVPEHGPVLILVKYDVTEEQLVRSAGRDAEMRFRQVFEQSPIGLCLVNPEGGFEKVNRSFEAIVGYSAEDLTRMNFAEITHPEDLEKDLEMTAELFAGKRESFNMEKRYIRKNGEVVWIELTVVMLDDVDDQPYQALSMVEDITERHRLGEQLKYLADHDPLTGLFNRRRFKKELASAISAGHDRGIAILVIDLDNFKFVNDSYGHTVGDRMIVRTAELLRSRLRSDDTLARQGGDEFVVVLRDIHPEDALGMAEDLVRLIARDVRVEGAAHATRVTASIGVAASSESAPVPGETLLMQADIAMYEAKDSGRNNARIFRPGEDSHVTLGIDWAGRLRSALANDEVLLYAQPILRLDGSGPSHFELFVRLRDPDGGIILPGAFLPTAERHDLVQELDRWVISKAIDTLAGLDGADPPRLQINLSGRTVGDPRLAEFVDGKLEGSGVDPSNLIFEMTETSAIGNMTRAREFSQRMNGLGCGFALDDFGTGFASFFYLKHLAFDYVKIDGEFVRELATDPVNRLLVKGLVEISRNMAKQTMAEQVEDAQTLEILRGYGVDFVQGYHLGRPRPLDGLELGPRTESPLDAAPPG